MARQIFARSRYTLAEPLGGGDGILVNAFSGAVDIVPAALADRIAGARQLVLDEECDDDRALIERGYFVESRECEDAAARLVARRAKQAALADKQIKYMFSLTLRCNLACNYCWQVIEHRKTRQKTALMSEEVVDAAFRFIDQDMAVRGKTQAFMSLFGGEPLIDRPQFHALVRLIGERVLDRGHHLHFTTNGRHLGAYRSEIDRYHPSIQITVDGICRIPGEGLTLTRAGQPLRNLLPLLRELVATRASGGIFLRFLVNTDTVADFVTLADEMFADPDVADGIQLACAPLQNKAARTDPAIPEKYRILDMLANALAGRAYAKRISYVDWRSLNLFAGLRGGDDVLPAAMFFHCEANVDLTCFDQDGRLYACYEAIGDQEMSIGRFWPEVDIDAGRLSSYRDRSAFTMAQCTDCAVSPICGGGCEVRGYKRSGDYALPYCDDLHAETALVMRNWRRMHSLLVGD